jgi:hypothetical protein
MHCPRQLLDADAVPLEFVAKPQLGELTNGIRLQVDAQSKCRDLGRRFEHVRVDAGCMQAQGGCHASDPAPDDDHVHSFLAVCTSCAMTTSVVNKPLPNK